MLLPVLLLSVPLAVCWENGAPQKACVDSFPHHHNMQPQYDEGPYRVTLNATSYAPGDVIQVTLGSIDGTPFKGFQLRANKVTGDKEDLIGQFIQAPNNTRLQFWYPKNDGEYNCATHKDNAAKDEIVLLWKAPTISVGDIFFRSGMVKNFDLFWPSVKSVVLTATVPAQVIENNEMVTSMLPDPAFGVECGISKGCLLYPPSCSGSSCRYGVSYKPSDDGQSIIIELMGETDGYVSVGFSEDKIMGHDSVVTCFLKDNDVGFHHSYCPARYCSRINIDNITDMAIKREDGRLFCRFVRPLDLTSIIYVRDYQTGAFKATKPVKFDLNLEWFIFLAWGEVYPGYDAWEKHHQLPLVSHRKVNLLKTEVVSGQTLPFELQLHATFGMLAWFALVGTSMLLARHYRDELPKPCFGVALWFQLHRLGMFAVLVSSIISIIIIFVYLTIWTEYAGLHAVFSLVAVGFSLIQTFAGLCRPGLDSKYRLAFNWAHRIGALVAFVAAAIAMFLGARNVLLHPAMRQVETIILAVGLFFQVFWEVLLEVQQLRTVKKNDVSKENSKSNGEGGVGKMEIEDGQKTGGCNFKRIVLVCFVLTSVVTLVLAILCIFEIGLF